MDHLLKYPNLNNYKQEYYSEQVVEKKYLGSVAQPSQFRWHDDKTKDWCTVMVDKSEQKYISNASKTSLSIDNARTSGLTDTVFYGNCMFSIPEFRHTITTFLFHSVS